MKNFNIVNYDLTIAQLPQEYAPGVSWLYKLMTKMCKGTGLDIGGAGFEDGRKPFPGGIIVDPRKPGSGNAYDLGMYPDNTYDFVLMSHVLEHLEDPEKGMEEAYKKLKPGGIVFTFNPHESHGTDPAHNGVSWNPKRYPPSAAEHKWQPTPTTVGRLMLMAGFKVTYMEPVRDEFFSFVVIGEK